MKMSSFFFQHPLKVYTVGFILFDYNRIRAIASLTIYFVSHFLVGAGGEGLDCPVIHCLTFYKDHYF